MNATEIISKYGTNFTKSSLKNGQEIHKVYKIDERITNIKIKEYRGVKGCRPDYVDLQNHRIYELKPYNPQGIKNGIRQLEKYKITYENRFGGTWETFLDFY